MAVLTILTLATSGCTGGATAGTGTQRDLSAAATASQSPSANLADPSLPRLSSATPGHVSSPDTTAGVPEAKSKVGPDHGAGARFIESASEAGDALVRVHVPHTSHLQHGAVAPGLLRLPQLDPTSTAFRLARWYVVPASPPTVVAFINAHAVAGYVRHGVQGSLARGAVRYTFVPKSGDSPQNSVSETVAVVNGRTGLLVQADAPWRASGERPRGIPIGLTSATLTSPLIGGHGGTADHSQALYGTALLGILGALDGATPSSTGVTTCAKPTKAPATITIVFRGAHIVVREDSRSCGRIAATVDGLGETRPSLFASALGTAVSKAIADAATGVAFPAPASAVHSEAAARSEGRKILGLVRRPTEASTIASAPPGLEAQDFLSARAGLVDVTRFWRVAHPPIDVNAYLLHLTIPHFTSTFVSIGSPSGVTEAGYDQTGVPSDLGAQVGITWVAEGDGAVDIRVDAFVPWTAPHP